MIISNPLHRFSYPIFMMFIPLIGYTQAYSPSASANYADVWTCDISNGACDPLLHNPAFSYYSGNDCANFVSQCLIAGGLSLWAGSNGTGNGVNAYGCIPYCDNLHLNLLNYQNTNYSGHLSNSVPAWFTKGDVVLFGNNSSDYWQHAAINIASGSPSLDAHTNNRYHRPVAFFYPGSFLNGDFYHIINTSSTVCNNDFSCGPPLPMVLPISSSCNYTSCSTTDATPPSPNINYYGAGSCSSLYNAARYDDDVWFTITPTCANPLTISVDPTSNTGNFDVCVGLYQGSCSSPSQVGCADVYGVGTTENLVYTPTAGTTYLVRVFSYGIGSTFSGDFDICVTQSCLSCPDAFEANNSCASSTLVFANPLGVGTSNYTIDANIGYAGDQDWFKVQVEACGTLTLNLTNLPYNYDLELYGSGCLSQWISGSYNSGLSNEQIIYTSNTVSPTTLYAKVYPYNPANYTTSSCYGINFDWASSLPSQPGAISGNISVCAGTSQSYSISAVSGATSYVWTLPSGWTGSSTGTTITTMVGSMGGAITVAAISSCGTSTPQTLLVNVNNVNTSVMNTGLVLTANASPATYQWVTCPSFSLLAGQMNQSYMPSSTGNYAVIVNENGCVDTSGCYSIIVTTGIQTLEVNEPFSVYPNPTDGVLNIKVMGLLDEKCKIGFSNSLGQSVQEFDFLIPGDSYLYQIDLSKFSTGLYFLKIHTKTYQRVFKIQKL